MNKVILLIILLNINLVVFAGERKYKIISDKQINYAKKELNAKLAPLLLTLLKEIEMSHKEAITFRKKFNTDAWVEGRYAQIGYDYKTAKNIISKIPEQMRKEFMRLTYQWVGPSSLWRNEVSEKLKLSKAQYNKVQNTYINYLEQLAPANRPDFHYGMSNEEGYKYHIRTLEIEGERDKALLCILTPVQRNSWDKLLGPPSRALKDLRDYCEKHYPGKPKEINKKDSK